MDGNRSVVLKAKLECSPSMRLRNGPTSKVRAGCSEDASGLCDERLCGKSGTLQALLFPRHSSSEVLRTAEYQSSEGVRFREKLIAAAPVEAEAFLNLKSVTEHVGGWPGARVTLLHGKPRSRRSTLEHADRRRWADEVLAPAVSERSRRIGCVKAAGTLLPV